MTELTWGYLHALLSEHDILEPGPVIPDEDLVAVVGRVNESETFPHSADEVERVMLDRLRRMRQHPFPDF
jgi:hypothetical protein